MDGKFYWFDYNETIKDSPLKATWKVVEGYEMECIIDDSCLLEDDLERNIVANCIYMFLLKKPYFKQLDYWVFVFDPYHGKDFYEDYVINIYNDYVKYPKTIDGKIDLMLLNISFHLNSISDKLNSRFVDSHFRTFLPESNDSQSYYPSIKYLCEMEYFNEKTWRLTAKGWKRLETLENNFALNQIFIASQFKGFEEVIKTLKQTISELSYNPVCMDDYQTNDYIMPEIFNLIKMSKAVVGEISSNNSGVYFEIGYAKALGKDIILVCKEEFDENGQQIMPAHFDVAQVSIIFYKDIDDLKKRLKFRINNTIKMS